MKHTLKISGLLGFLFVIIITSCSKSNSSLPFNPDYTLNNIADAVAAHDHSNYGIYKAVAINAGDSTASFRIDLCNKQPQPYVLYYRNNKVEDSLIRYQTDANGSFLYNWQPDRSAVPANSFYHTAFASYRIGMGPIVSFGVQANGTDPQTDILLMNNATLVAILKERSDKQVRCFEGSYSGQDSGRIAFVMTNDSAIAIRASIWNPQFFKKMAGKVTNESFSLYQYDDLSGNSFVFNGTIQNNQCSGNWVKNANPVTGNLLIARRTL